MLKYIESQDFYQIDEKTISAYRQADSALRSEIQLKSIQIETKQNYLDSVNAFLDWYIMYANKITGNKNYPDKNLATVVFVTAVNSENQFKEYIRYSLFISRQYVEYLRSKINIVNIINYDTVLGNLDTDLEWLIANTEMFLTKSTNGKAVVTSSGRSRRLTPFDIYSASKSLFFIEEFENTSDIYLRDLKPVIMFSIRQCIEMYGKNILGYLLIKDSKTDQPIKKFTQIAWDFLSEESKKKDSRIDFPFDVQMILNISRWTNSFVHTTYLHTDYIHFFALRVIEVLFVPSPNPVTDFRAGTPFTRFDCADIKIRDYNSIKKDFENYLDGRLKSKPKPWYKRIFSKKVKSTKVKIDWMPESQVGAYIMNL